MRVSPGIPFVKFWRTDPARWQKISFEDDKKKGECKSNRRSLRDDNKEGKSKQQVLRLRQRIQLESKSKGNCKGKCGEFFPFD